MNNVQLTFVNYVSSNFYWLTEMEKYESKGVGINLI